MVYFICLFRGKLGYKYSDANSYANDVKAKEGKKSQNPLTIYTILLHNRAMATSAEFMNVIFRDIFISPATREAQLR